MTGTFSGATVLITGGTGCFGSTFAGRSPAFEIRAIRILSSWRVMLQASDTLRAARHLTAFRNPVCGSREVATLSSSCSPPEELGECVF